MRKRAVRKVSAPWLDPELKEYMKQRDEVKMEATKTNDVAQWSKYRKLRNLVTKLNKCKKLTYYQKKIDESKLDSAKLWGTLNELMGRNSNRIPTFLEGDGIYLTNPKEIANYLSQFFKNKIYTYN